MSRRMRAWSTAAIVLTVAAGTACSPGPEGPREFTGTLGGFWHFEAQCAYLHVGEDRFSLRVPEPLELRIEEGPEETDVAVVAADGSVIFSEGDALRALGTVSELPAGAPCGEQRLLRASELSAAP